MDAFKSIGIENFYEKLVGFGSEGASVNKGDKEGVKAILKRKNPWLSFGWCVAHRFELKSWPKPNETPIRIIVI